MSNDVHLIHPENQTFLLYKENSAFLNHRNAALINEVEIRSNILRLVPGLYFPITTIVYGLSISLLMMFFSALVTIHALQDLRAQFIHSINLSSLLIGLAGIILGPFGVYAGYTLFKNIMLQRKHILGKKPADRLYVDLINNGKLQTGTVIQVGSNFIKYKYDYTEAEPAYGTYQVSKAITGTKIEKVVVLYNDITSVLI